MKGFSKGRMRLRRQDGKTYLARRRISTPWFRIFLHKMEAPDPGQHLHDHPWNFVSLILWGGYEEQRCDTRTASQRAGWTESPYSSVKAGYGDYARHGMFSLNRMPLNMAHRITRLNRKTCWTLVIGGRRVRDWGFYPASGYVRHDAYDSKLYRGDLYVEGNDGDG